MKWQLLLLHVNLFKANMDLTTRISTQFTESVYSVCLLFNPQQTGLQYIRWKTVTTGLTDTFQGQHTPSMKAFHSESAARANKTTNPYYNFCNTCTPTIRRSMASAVQQQPLSSRSKYLHVSTTWLRGCSRTGCAFFVTLTDVQCSWSFST